MEKLKPFVALLCLLTTVSLKAQVVIGGEENKTTKEEEKSEPLVEMNNKPARQVEGTSSLYFFASRAYNNRSLKENEGLFGDTIGKRADETGLKTACLGFGFRNQVGKSWFIGGGVTVYNNGESYAFEGSDSTFNYTSKYSYIGMPIFVEYTVGETFQFIGTAGIAPSMFVRYKQEQNWMNAKNVEGDTLIKLRNGDQQFNTFVVSAFVSAGVALKISETSTIYVKPEYRLQLNSSYSQINPFIHKARAFSVNFGLIYDL